MNLTNKDVIVLKKFKEELEQSYKSNDINSDEICLDKINNFITIFNSSDLKLEIKLFSEWESFQITKRKEIIEGNIRIFSKIISKMEKRKKWIMKF